MSESIKYRGRCEWASFGVMAMVLHGLTRVFPDNPPPRNELRDLIDRIDMYAHQEVGPILLFMDEYLVDVAACEWFIRDCEMAIEWFKKHGPVVAGDEFNRWNLGGGQLGGTNDVPVAPAIDLLERIICLIASADEMRQGTRGNATER